LIFHAQALTRRQFRAFKCNITRFVGATSPGKGAVDGVGGKAKRVVQTAIKNRKWNVSTAMEYSECAKKLLDKIQVIHVPVEDIASRKEQLDATWCNVKSVPGTHDLQCIRSLCVGEIECSILSENLVKNVG
jgi:hypothetical protein